MPPEYEGMSSDMDQDKEIGPKEGQGIDEVEGVPNEQLEKAHQDDAAKEAAEEEQHKE